MEIDSVQTNSLEVNGEAVSGGSNPNLLINGNFDIWQRGTSQVNTSGYASDDRWFNAYTGPSTTCSQQSFTIGQTDVPNNPDYYSRTVVTLDAASASFFVAKQQRIESVKTLSSKTATLSFWAKANASKDLTTEFVQYFGTGGSPSSTVTTIGVTTHSLTTSWQKFTVTADIPSISGKTLGTAGDDFLQVNFWFYAGADYNSRTNSIGYQDGTFDIAQAKLEEGSVATPFIPRPIAEELALCQRYFQEQILHSRAYDTLAAAQTYTVLWPVTFRATPTTDVTVTTNTNISAYDLDISASRCFVYVASSTTGYAIWQATVELDAEL